MRTEIGPIQLLKSSAGIDRAPQIYNIYEELVIFLVVHMSPL